LEGEKYPTGSSVVSTIYSIRAHYVNILNNEHALEPVKNLTWTLLEDFNDALKYWAANESQSPELAQLAKEYLTIPATSAYLSYHISSQHGL
jgi:hypothetical protein